jgi:DNA repair protein RadC
VLAAGGAAQEEYPITNERLTIRDWPEQDKPRERLERLGAQYLSDAEVVAILLGTGNSSETALGVAQRILAQSEGQFGTSLGFLLNWSPDELKGIAGIGPAKAARLAAAVEIGRRLNQQSVERRFPVTRGKEVFEYIRLEAETLDKEHFWILTLNSRNQITGKDLVSVGSLDAAIVHPREIFKCCIKKSAAAIILVHNHPSGDPDPSDEDMDITRRLVEAGKLLGIHVLDHVVVARGKYYSMRESCPGYFSV